MSILTLQTKFSSIHISCQLEPTQFGILFKSKFGLRPEMPGKAGSKTNWTVQYEGIKYLQLNDDHFLIYGTDKLIWWEHENLELGHTIYAH